MSANAIRTILVTAPLRRADIAACARRISAVAGQCDVASVIVRLEPGASEADVAPLARLAEDRDIALLSDVAAEALRPEFDGAHVGAAGFDAAIRTLHPGKIVGAGGLGSRDAAMAAGEAGADYVMFGEDGAAEAATDLVAWWAEVMQPPCAGHAATVSNARAFAAAGADFIALAPELWSEATAFAELLRALAADAA